MARPSSVPACSKLLCEVENIPQLPDSCMAPLGIFTGWKSWDENSLLYLPCKSVSLSLLLCVRVRVHGDFQYSRNLWCKVFRDRRNKQVILNAPGCGPLKVLVILSKFRLFLFEEIFPIHHLPLIWFLIFLRSPPVLSYINTIAPFPFYPEGAFLVLSPD